MTRFAEPVVETLSLERGQTGKGAPRAGVEGRRTTLLSAGGRIVLEHHHLGAVGLPLPLHDPASDRVPVVAERGQLASGRQSVLEIGEREELVGRRTERGRHHGMVEHLASSTGPWERLPGENSPGPPQA